MRYTLIYCIHFLVSLRSVQINNIYFQIPCKNRTIAHSVLFLYRTDYKHILHFHNIFFSLLKSYKRINLLISSLFHSLYVVINFTHLFLTSSNSSSEVSVQIINPCLCKTLMFVSVQKSFLAEINSMDWNEESTKVYG